MWSAPGFYNQFDKDIQSRNKYELQQNINILNLEILNEKNKNKQLIKQLEKERGQWSIQKKFYENQIDLLSRLSLS